MKINKLKHKLQKVGLILLQHEKGFTVTDNAVKNPVEENFPNLEAVEKWLNNKEMHNNRLDDTTALEWMGKIYRFAT